MGRRSRPTVRTSGVFRGLLVDKLSSKELANIYRVDGYTIQFEFRILDRNCLPHLFGRNSGATGVEILETMYSVEVFLPVNSVYPPPHDRLLLTHKPLVESSNLSLATSYIFMD